MKYKLVALAFVVSLTVTAIFLYSEYSSSSSKFLDTGGYISFTVSYMESFDITKVMICKYNLRSKKISEVFTFPLNAMYALGVFDERSNCVYYSKEKSDNSFERINTGDQIYMYNLTTGTDTMLTEDLFAVNFIELDDDAVFFIAARQNSVYNLVLGKIDISDGSIKYWDETGCAATRIMSIDRERKRIYVAIYNTEEEDIAIYTAYKTGATEVPPKHTVCSYDYDLGNKQEVLHKDEMAIKALYILDDWLLYRADNTMAPRLDTSTISEVINLNNMEVLFQFQEYFAERGCFSRNKNGVYTLGSIGEHSSILYFDFETKEYTPIIKSSIGSIANFQLVFFSDKTR